MRYSITLEIIKTDDPQVVHIIQDYQYFVAMWIENLLSLKKESIANTIQKFCLSKPMIKNKLYTFTNIDFGKTIVNYNIIQLTQQTGEFVFSTLQNDMIEKIFLEQFENQILSLPGKNATVEFKVTSIQKLSQPDFSNDMNFTTVAPMTLNYKDHTTNIYNEYMYPKGERFNDLFFLNLQEKTTMLMNLDNDFKEIDKNKLKKFSLLSATKSKSVILKSNNVKPLNVKGYDFSFNIKGPIEFLKAGYYLGFGENNSLGFGMCDIATDNIL